jgi:hypothetical protein
MVGAEPLLAARWGAIGHSLDSNAYARAIQCYPLFLSKDFTAQFRSLPFPSHLAPPELLDGWDSHTVRQNPCSDGPQFMPFGLLEKHIVIQLQGMLAGNTTDVSAAMILRKRLAKATVILLMSLFSQHDARSRLVFPACVVKVLTIDDVMNLDWQHIQVRAANKI